MDKRHKKTLLENRLIFLKDIEPDDITGFLYQDRVISENDKETIESIKTKREKIEHILDLLPRKGPHAYQKFINILKHYEKYSRLTEVLELNGVTLKEEADGKLDFVDGFKSDLTEQYYSNAPFYRFSPSNAGCCVIINNVDFLSLPKRYGSDTDCENLKTIFEKLGFTSWIIRNGNSDGIVAKLKSLAEQQYGGDAFVLCILSHGLMGKIYCSDGDLISIADILNLLSSKSLSKIPKLVLIQACRVSDEVNQHSGKANASEVISNPIGLMKYTKAYDLLVSDHEQPMESEILLGYSTFPGEVAYRNVVRGSFFVESVVHVFKEYALKEDVLSMMIRVNSLVKEKLGGGQVQIPAPVVTLTKKLFLYGK